MSKRNKSGDHVKNHYYDAHLFGVRRDNMARSSNPQADRLSVIQRMYIRHLTEISVNRFKWTGLPKTVDPRFMELTLFKSALSIFYYEHDLKRFLALPGHGTGQKDMMDNWTHFQTSGNNWANKRLPRRMCVPIYSNYLRIPDLDIVQVYATKFADLDLTIEINAHNARRNKYMVTSEDQRVTAENINRQLDEGQTVRMNFDAFNPTDTANMFGVVDLGVNPDHVEKLHILKVRLYNECMEMLGIKTANQDKKERMVADEVDANEESSLSTQMVALNERRAAAQRINDMWGLDVSVEYHADAIKQLSSAFDPENGYMVPEGYPSANKNEGR